MFQHFILRIAQNGRKTIRMLVLKIRENKQRFSKAKFNRIAWQQFAKQPLHGANEKKRIQSIRNDAIKGLPKCKNQNDLNVSRTTSITFQNLIFEIPNPPCTVHNKQQARPICHLNWRARTLFTLHTLCDDSISSI